MCARISRNSGMTGSQSTTRAGGWSEQHSPIGLPTMDDKVIDFINVNRDRYLEELKALLAIPSISALPEHADDVKRCADWCADEMRRIGLQNVRLLETPGYPVAYGEWLGAPGAP